MSETTETEDLRARAAGMLKIASERLVWAHPFHAGLLGQGVIEADVRVVTMAVTVHDGRLQFLYAPAFVCECRVDEVAAVLHHELNHVLFGHLFADQELYPDRRARIIAEEVTANEWVPEDLPGDPILLEHYPFLPADEDTDARYKRLTNRSAPGRNQPGRGQKTADSVPETRGRGQERGGQIEPVDDHTVWADARNEGDLGRLVVEVAIAEARSGLTRDEWTTIPAALQERIQQAGDRVDTIRSEGRGTIDWGHLLRQHVRRMTDPLPTLGRVPRRFPELVGVVPGRARRAGRARVMAVIDTSGSIRSRELARITSELDRLARIHEVVVVECDAEIQATYNHTGPFHRVTGGGGTDLRPPFAREFLRRIGPDVVVYFTDGRGVAPKRAPTVPAIWCLTPDGESHAHWGQVIYMRERTCGCLPEDSQ